jgi:hypothetical protein
MSRLGLKRSGPNGKWSQQELDQLSRKFGGRCLTKRYRHAHQLLRWQCREGHVFRRTVSHMAKNRTCPDCQAAKRADAFASQLLRKVRNVCAKRRGILLKLSAPKKGGSKRCSWRAKVVCVIGHQWHVATNELLSGSWCQKCHIAKMVSRRDYKKSLGLAPFVAYAKSRGGTCISTSYVNSDANLKFRCAENHVFTLQGSSARAGHWCRECSFAVTARKRRAPIELIRSEARARGGKCLSNAYDDSSKPLLWKCHLKHHSAWEARWHKVKIGQWCPECASGFGERVVRLAFQKLFKAAFPKARPKWLAGENGALRELDGFNESLKIAFEHHGRQHYAYTPFLSESRARFRALQQRDEDKRMALEKRGVRLIVVPEVGGMLPLSDLEAHIRVELEALGVTAPTKKLRAGWWYPAYSGRQIQSELRALKKRR